MEGLRRRYVDAQEADQARNSLIEDLLQRVGDLQKQMDRHGFVLVLIDGDCMNFLNELVQQGIPGGDEAAKRLRRAVFEYLRYDEDFNHDYKIVVRVYANLRGLGKTYFDGGVLPTPAAFSDFVLGFNKSHPLCDFIDAGNHKEAADTKLKETLSLYVYNVHCKQIVFGASADNGYASFLSSVFVDTDIPSRLRLLKGPPFSYEFQNMLSKFKWTEFKTVFRGELISSQPKHLHTRQRSVEADEAHARESSSVSKLGTPALPWRPKVNPGQHSSNATLQSYDPNDLIDMSSGSSGRGTPILRSGTPTAEEIVTALVCSAVERLKQTPLDINFGVVKAMAAQKLGVSINFWGTNDQYEWFSKSKNIIKKTTENWIEATDNPPPKNATWMLYHFEESRSPSATIKSPSADAWRTKLDFDMPELDLEIVEKSQQGEPTSVNSDVEGVPINTARKEDVDRKTRMGWNAQGERIDIPSDLRVNIRVTEKLRERKPRLCNTHHLLGSCPWNDCPYDHEYIPTDEEWKALMLFSRSTRCHFGSACYDEDCVKGHMCPTGKYCTYGSRCRFADLHGMDTRLSRNGT